MSTTISLVALSALSCLNCHIGKETPAENGTETVRMRVEDRLFQRRLECGKLLARMEDSTLGPPSHRDEGVLPGAPVVFYSPTLNTCVHLGANVFTGNTAVQPSRSYMREVISVEDLLSGQTLLEDRQFNLNDAAEAAEARNYQAEVIQRFGGVLPVTGLQSGWEGQPKPQK